MEGGLSLIVLGQVDNLSKGETRLKYGDDVKECNGYATCRTDKMCVFF